MSGVTRRLPRPSELRTLARRRPVILNPTERRLSKAFTISDLRTIAKRRTPQAVFDYTDGAAEEEISLQRARHTFRDLEFTPSVLHDVSAVDLTTTVLGRESAVPFAFAPTGFTRLMQHEGESAVARVAARRSIPYALSTMGTTSIEGVRAAVDGITGPCGDPRLWFQLYVWRDRAAATDLVARAAAAGYEALILTVDVPVAGARLRDARNGFSIPASLSLRTLSDMALHPAWWANVISTEPLAFASMSEWRGTVAELLDALFDPTMTIADLEWLRGQWQGPLIVKGIQSVDDARRVVAAGADAVLLSNHGGRQLDRAPVPLRLVPDVRDAVGESAEVWVDTGILSGADVLAAIALGATTALVGRAYLYGLMAGGERGVDKAAQILTQQAERTMKLLGVQSVAELGARHVRLP